MIVAVVERQVSQMLKYLRNEKEGGRDERLCK